MKPADLLGLVRWKIAAAAALSTLAGAAAFSASYVLHPSILAPTLGTLLLAMGASALNQVQEHASDALMERTRNRPVAAGRLGRRPALIVSALSMAAGGLSLALAGPVPALLGSFAVIWYNGVYTPLKPLTAFAAIPGALVGAAPPAMGWTAAGGALLDPRLAALVVVFVAWQFPHFWLLHARFGHQLERAGLPSLTRRLGPGQADRIAFTWIVTAAATTGLLPLFGFGTRAPPFLYPTLGGVLVATAGWLLLRTGARERSQHRLFTAVNGYFLALLVLLALDRLLRLA